MWLGKSKGLSLDEYKRAMTIDMGSLAFLIDLNTEEWYMLGVIDLKAHDVVVGRSKN